MLSVTHIALENCPISKVTVDRDQRGDSGGAEQHGGGEAETLDEDGPEFFATTCLTGLCLLKCFASYIFFVAQDAKLTTTSGVHTVIIGTRSSPVVAHTSNVASEAVKLGMKKIANPQSLNLFSGLLCRIPQQRVPTTKNHW